MIAELTDGGETMSYDADEVVPATQLDLLIAERTEARERAGRAEQEIADARSRLVGYDVTPGLSLVEMVAEVVLSAGHREQSVRAEAAAAQARAERLVSALRALAAFNASSDFGVELSRERRPWREVAAQVHDALVLRADRTALDAVVAEAVRPWREASRDLHDAMLHVFVEAVRAAADAAVVADKQFTAAQFSGFIVGAIRRVAKERDDLREALQATVDALDRGDHAVLCDVNEPGPQLGPGTKPCNCGYSVALARAGGLGVTPKEGT